jgi:hypothetical protein
VGIVGNDSREIIRDDSFGHYEIYVVSLQLKGESSLIKFSKEKDGNLQIYGITGRQMEIKDQVKLKTHWNL